LKEIQDIHMNVFLFLELMSDHWISVQTDLIWGRTNQNSRHQVSKTD